MRIAIFGTTELQTFPELADISRRHTVTPFLAEATDASLRGWHNELRHSSYDVLHFTGHISRDERQRPVWLHVGPLRLAMDDVVMMAKLANARCIFFNSCESAMFANYAIRNGIHAAIYTTADLGDSDAWKFPLHFYEQVARQESDQAVVDLRKAFDASVDHSGFYGWASNGTYERDLLSPLIAEIGRVREDVSALGTQMDGRVSMYEGDVSELAKRLHSLSLIFGGVVFFELVLMFTIR